MSVVEQALRIAQRHPERPARHRRPDGERQDGARRRARRAARRRGRQRRQRADLPRLRRRLRQADARTSWRARRTTSSSALDPLEPRRRGLVGGSARPRAIDDVRARGRVPIVCGGTFLWVKALLFGLAEAPAASAEHPRAAHARWPSAKGGRRCTNDFARSIRPSAERLHPNDFVRVSRALEVFELTGRPLSDWQREHALRARAAPGAARGHRLRRPRRSRSGSARACAGWLADGWIEEVEALLAAGYGDARAMGSVGYAQVRAMLAGRAPARGARDGHRARHARVRAPAAHVAEPRRRDVAAVVSRVRDSQANHGLGTLLRPSSGLRPDDDGGMVAWGAAHPLVASPRASPASPSASRAAARRETRVFLPRLRAAKSFAEGERGRLVAKPRGGAQHPTMQSPPPSSAKPTRGGG